MSNQTREEWLREVLVWTSKDIFGCGITPEQPTTIRASVGWPSAGGLGKKRPVIGQCWAIECSEEKYSEIFVSPVLKEGGEVVETLLHETGHAIAGVSEKHRGQFIVVCKAIGFTKPWTQTPATPELKEKIARFLETFPPYPHAKLTPTSIEGPNKPQKNRQLKLSCPSCGYVVRSTKKWIELGLPTCHCGQLFVAEATDGEE